MSVLLIYLRIVPMLLSYHLVLVLILPSSASTFLLTILTFLGLPLFLPLWWHVLGIFILMFWTSISLDLISRSLALDLWNLALCRIINDRRFKFWWLCCPHTPKCSYPLVARRLFLLVFYMSLLRSSVWMAFLYNFFPCQYKRRFSPHLLYAFVSCDTICRHPRNSSTYGYAKVLSFHLWLRKDSIFSSICNNPLGILSLSM